MSCTKLSMISLPLWPQFLPTLPWTWNCQPCYFLPLTFWSLFIPQVFSQVSPLPGSSWHLIPPSLSPTTPPPLCSYPTINITLCVIIDVCFPHWTLSLKQFLAHSKHWVFTEWTLICKSDILPTRVCSSFINKCLLFNNNFKRVATKFHQRSTNHTILKYQTKGKHMVTVPTGSEARKHSLQRVDRSHVQLICLGAFGLKGKRPNLNLSEDSS